MPLFHAAVRGFTDVVRRLLESGADPNVRMNSLDATDSLGQPTYSRWQPLHGAVEANQLDTVELLLRAGASLNSSNWFQTSGSESIPS